MQFLTAISHFVKTLTTPHPARDWYGVFFFSVFIACVLIGVSLYFLVGIQSGIIVIPKQESEISGVPSISRASLDQAIDAYKERTVNFDSENYSPPAVSDPAE